MNFIKVGVTSLNQTAMSWEHNKNNIINAIKEAKERKISILLLPELSITGYGCEDWHLSPDLHRTSLDILNEIKEYTQDIIVVVGLPLFHNNSVFNTVALVTNKKVEGFVAKHYLAGDGVHYEPRWFKAWPEEVIDRVMIDNVKFPIGDFIFNCSGVKIGFEICEDAWVATRPGGELAKRGVDIILNPSASHFAFDKIDTRKRFVIEGSRAFNVSYLYANLLGNEAGRMIYEGDGLIASAGKLIAKGSRFSFKDYEITDAIIDVDKTRMNQAKISSFKPEFNKNDELEIVVDFDWPIQDSFPSLSFEDDKNLNEDSKTDNSYGRVINDIWENSKNRKMEEFVRAESLALFDYMRKSYSKGFVVSLSGGADSTTVVALVHMMVKLAVKDLGLDGFKKKLSYFKKIQNCKTEEEIIKILIVTLYQATENSGDITHTAAFKVAEGLSATFYDFNINSIVENYVSLVEGALKRDLTWERDDITLQNIQARTRAPLAWMFANINNMLLVSTSNRSEAAVGYATMDGDTAGGISPIAGVDKNFIREWLVWMEKEGPVGFERLEILSYVNVQAPTAELRPQENKQTDEDDLMPYNLLDFIEKIAIRDKKGPLEVYKLILHFFPQYSKLQLLNWTKRFFSLWSRNQWKRERYAPSFHLDDENLDPKTWCRFPILSGGFYGELKRLEEYVKDSLI